MSENNNFFENINNNLANIYIHFKLTKKHVKMFLSILFLALGIVFMILGASKGGAFSIIGVSFIVIFIPLMFFSFFSFSDLSKLSANITLAQMVFFILIFIIIITFLILSLMKIKGKPNTNEYVLVYPANQNGNIDLEAEPSRLTMNGDTNYPRPFVFQGNQVGFVRGHDLTQESPSEFTYSFWLNISPRNFNPHQRNWRTVFSKGPTSTTGDSQYDYTRKNSGYIFSS